MVRKPYVPRDFLWTRSTPADIRRMGERAVRLVRSAHAAVKAIPDGERTFENTIYPLERASADAGTTGAKIGLLMNVHPDRKVRDAAKTASLRLEKTLIDLDYDEKLYAAVAAYARAKEKLPPAEKKLLADTLRGYRRMGFGLSRAVRDRVQANTKKLRAAETAFAKNINDWKDHIAVPPAELGGLPERYVAGLKKDARGRAIVTLDYPDSVPFMQYAASAPRRAELAHKLLRKGAPANMKLLAAMVRLRAENARLLGYRTHADYRLEVRMAKRARAAQAFVARLLRRLAPALRKDLARLTAMKRAMTRDPRARLEHHDTAYYGKRLEEKELHINAEEIREYFPLATVKKGTFAIYERLLGVRFYPMRGFPLWHRDVELYRVNNASGSLVGYFALDLYPREGKYGHAAAFSVEQGRSKNYVPSEGRSDRPESRDNRNEYFPPLDVMVANFPKPAPGRPSLLSHDEVETFFHEFGHVMHAVLTEATYVSQAGTSVARDFVEAPSQMFEYWVWDKKTINMLSGHYRHPKRKLPPAMLTNLLRSKYHLVANFTVRQLIFARFDLALHTGEVKGDAAAFHRALVKKHVGITLPKDAIFPAGFGHLTDYDAGYYGYLWSRVYAADMFTRFGAKRILDPRVGRAYRREVLAPGSSREEMDSVKAFLGRKPNEKAFLKEITPRDQGRGWRE